MLEILDQIEHVGELTRIVSVYREVGATSLHRRELVALTTQSATLSHRYPRPESSIDLAIALQLLVARKSHLDLTQVGRRFLGACEGSRVDVNRAQARILLGLFLDNAETRRVINSAVRAFYSTPKGLKAKLSDLRSDADLMRVVRLFQQLGFAMYRGTELFLDEEFCQDGISDVITLSASLGEDELWERLERQRERARLIEDKVVEWEKSRLREMGESALAEAVVRVSSEDVTAGYDIESFNEDRTPRLIEVKSSTGSQIRFYWSSNERRVAAQNRTSYWIYFVPFADLNELNVMTFSDPIGLVESGAWMEEPASFEITGTVQSRHLRRKREVR